jgi:thymidylate synthase (FAD)
MVAQRIIFNAAWLAEPWRHHPRRSGSSITSTGSRTTGSTAVITVRHIATTQQMAAFPEQSDLNNAETLMVYCARVSNPESQEAGENPERLLSYCIRKRHWSVFEMVDMVVEIEAPRDITRQLIRHKSLCVQEFSQRYAEATQFELRECRLQDTVNRQSSVETTDENATTAWIKRQRWVITVASAAYREALELGIAKEVARAVLPEGLTMSRLFAKGSVRSWIHYCEVRRGNGTQKEHRELADLIWQVFSEQFPTVAAAVEGTT